jgi:hypothetical protein
VLCYRAAVTHEGLVVVQQGEKMTKYYGTPKDGNQLSVHWLKKDANVVQRRMQ